MKKIILWFGVVLFYSLSLHAEEINLQEIDSQARAERPNTNSIMFRRNAEMYRQLSDEERADISAQREEARKVRLQQEEYARRRAAEEMRRRQMEEAQREAERRRAEALRPITLYENKLKIYALVNGEVITSNDMQSRINAFILTTGIPYNPQTKAMITGKVLQSAIDEKLKIQEAEKNKIKVSQKEINSALRQFEQSNNIPAGQLKKILADAKVSVKVWSTQIEADLAWRKLIAQKGFDEVSVSENDISKALTEIKNDQKKQKFMVSEIVIDKKDAKDLQQLVENLRQDPRFELYAMQFSQSPSAANGGRLGWVGLGKLPAVLENAMLKMKDGEVSNPIAYGKDFYILKMEKIFNPAVDRPETPSRQEVRNFLENKKLEEFSNRYIKNLRSHALIEKKV
ncbi:MAG: peptidylprolyl isomerase [Pseudomonadota bacterium]|nr:peptidylprolyl isomerase [Pseudomonadota bacterium]